MLGLLAPGELGELRLLRDPLDPPFAPRTGERDLGSDGGRLHHDPQDLADLRPISVHRIARVPEVDRLHRRFAGGDEREIAIVVRGSAEPALVLEIRGQEATDSDAVVVRDAVRPSSNASRIGILLARMGARGPAREREPADHHESPPFRRPDHPPHAS
ncbi:MAG: hypothetical protein U5K51_11700, partial [Flavobacteriaceae bacterium]|nr:hypothetical protein [Flavobacteriaceae bacterium]